MNLPLLHRRLVVGMGLAGLLAFAGGAGFEPAASILAAIALITALFWQPSSAISGKLEHLWLPLAGVLVLRALAHVFLLGGDVVIPVVDLLLLLLCAEALRSLDADNDARLYSLSFALILASTAYRPGILFAVAFVAYLSLGIMALTVGHLRRRSHAHGAEPPPVTPRFLAATGSLSVVVLLVSAVVFLTFPRVSRAWSGRGETLATSVAGFSDEVSLGEHGATIRSNPEIVLRVEFPEGLPGNALGLHWRGRSYDHFDGVRWSRSRGIRPSGGITEWYRAWGDSTLVQRIYGSPLDVRVLFTLHPVLDIEPESEIHPLFDNAGDFIYWGGDSPAYTAESVVARPDPDSLRAAERGYMPDREHYLQLPRLPDRIHALADSLTRGEPTRYDKAVAIERWLRSEFSYTMELPPTPREATLDHFLFERRAGHCEYFSTAMVILLRAAGVHSRNVNGFLGGRWSEFGRYLAVSQNEAHSWVEVWFPGYGWVDFDPTPAGSAAGTAEAIWYWPGSFLFDGMQHRWNKWVLDYSVSSQSTLLQQIFGERQEPVSGGGEGEGRWSWLWALAAVVLGAGGAVVLLRRRTGYPAATRLYLTLQEACRKEGWLPQGVGTVGPLELVGVLESAGHPAAGPARNLVELYVRARFGGNPPDPDTLRTMRESLTAARRSLSRATAPRPRPASPDPSPLASPS